MAWDRVLANKTSYKMSAPSTFLSSTYEIVLYASFTSKKLCYI